MAISSIFVNPSKSLAYSPLAARSVVGISVSSASDIANKVAKPTSKAYDGFIEWLARGMGRFASNKKTESFIAKFSKTKYPAHLTAIFANIQNLFYMYNVQKSDKIEENQKAPLMLNMFISTLLSTAGAYLIDDILKQKSSQVVKLIEKTYKDSDRVVAGYKIAQTLLIFQLLYRFVAPVVATPIANHISNKARERNNQPKLPV